jgi:sugar phosphate isomerase/epimerase
VQTQDIDSKQKNSFTYKTSTLLTIFLSFFLVIVNNFFRLIRFTLLEFPMKYAFMSFSSPESTLEELFAIARKYHYTSIEPRLSANHHHGIEFDTSPAQRSQIRDQVIRSGIKICCLATSCRYADPQIRLEQIQDTHHAIDLAADIGCTRIRVFGGQIPTSVTREAGIELVIESLLAVTAHAAERGVTLCGETHDDWCDPNHLVTVMQRVNHPRVRINWDIMHPARVLKISMAQAYQFLKPWIQHVHFHDGISEPDGSITLTSIGWGDIDHRAAVALLKKDNYSDFLSGEWINWEDSKLHLPRELATMQYYETLVAAE